MAATLPEVEEKSHFDVADFRVHDKIFATLPDESRVVLRLDPTEQAALLASSPDSFSAEGHWGRQGWTIVRLDAVDPDELRELVTDAWRRRAPKKLVAAYDQTGRGP